LAISDFLFLLVDKKKMSISIEDRCIGSLLCHMIGDQLGAAVEGFSSTRIKREHGVVRDDIAAPHMGIPELGPRIHMYTDDTNSMLALAHSLVVNEGLKPIHAAKSYAEFWSTGIKRGYPDSAQASMQVSLWV
jgi:ADP-ribosylglycohydrolase